MSLRVSANREGRSRTGVPAANMQPGKPPAIPFSQALQSERHHLLAQELDKLWVIIEEQGSSLTRSSPFEQWERYRQAVRDYLTAIKENCYCMRREQIWDRSGSQKLLLLVEEADKELLAVGNAFLEKQGNNLLFLARIQRLKGMLLDMRS